MMKNGTDSKMVSRLFFNMLPIQILIFAMGSINSLVDGTMAGRFIGPNAVGVIGLYFSMVGIMNAVGSVLLGGTAVLCGRYMGRGELKKTDGIFSLNITMTTVIGALLTLTSIAFPRTIANVLGANEQFMNDLVVYIVGYAIGIIPMLLAQQVAAFLQMERQSTLGYIGIAGMTISNIVLDVVFVYVLRMGMWGLALATSISNLIYCFILLPYYFSTKAQFHFGINNILWSEMGNLIKIGSPGALLVFCLSFREIVVNHILLRYAGSDGLSAKSAYSMVSGLFVAYCLANGAVIRMLISVFAGEEDKYSMRTTLKIVFTKGLALSCVVAAVVYAVSPALTSVFFPDRSSNVYDLTYKLFVIIAFCIPLILVAQIFTNYLQAMGHSIYVNFLSVFDGFISMVSISIILAPVMGAMGVWLANPLAILLTLLMTPIYCVIFWRRFPKNVDECMFLRPDFGIADTNMLNVSIHNKEELAVCSANTQEFCENHFMGKKTSYYAALCLEEMGGNVISHGFMSDKKKHSLNSMVMFKGDKIVLRIKDDCIPFNPTEMAELLTGDSDFTNMGIKMVFKIANDISYQNLLGLNVLTINLVDENLMMSEEDDFLLERTLKEENEDLHTRYRDTVFATQKILTKFKLLFPEYTDHSEFHSLTVIDSCNRLIGKDQISLLNADEKFILLTACYFHDVGMGVSEKDYEEFSKKLGEKEFFEENPNAGKADFVRINHHDFSGLLVEKYADLFEIPSPEHVFAIKQVVRGHRKTDLFDEKEYPSELRLPNGNTVCLPYLSALIRLADEIDVVATRNPLVLYDMADIVNEISIFENKKLMAVKSVRMTGNAFVFFYKTDEENIREGIIEMADKMQKTLDYCRDVVHTRTKFKIHQQKIILKDLGL